MTRHLFTGFQILSPSRRLIHMITHSTSKDHLDIKSNKVNQFFFFSSFDWIDTCVNDLLVEEKRKKKPEFKIEIQSFLYLIQTTVTTFFLFQLFFLSLSRARPRTFFVAHWERRRRRRENRMQTLLALYFSLCAHNERSCPFAVSAYGKQGKRKYFFSLSLSVWRQEGKKMSVYLRCLLALTHNDRPTTIEK